MKDYGSFVKFKEPQKVPFAEEEAKKAKLNILRCWEEESGTLNRINKSREIEKEFKEKKIEEVLLSNKETKRAGKETGKASGILIFSIIMLIIYAAVPELFVSISFYLSKTYFDVVLDMSKYCSNIYRYGSECSEVYTSLLQLSLINEYVLIINIK
jgi:tetrahydromethanopterin S-methyltransferase subunit G